MDLDKFARKIQNYLQNNPLVVLGSGSSVPFGLPTMGFLSTILKDTQFLRDNNCQQFLKNLDCMGLEDAINCSELSDEIKELIRIEIWNCINEADLNVFQSLLRGNQLNSLIILIKKLIEPIPNRIVAITTNYDRLFEYACDYCNVTVDNGFDGCFYKHFYGFSHEYDCKRLLGKKRLAKVLKVHGSLDWFVKNNSNELISVAHCREIPKGYKPLIVPPGRDKYSQTHMEPYRGIITEADKQFNNAECFLCIGYGFNDKHIQPKLLEQIHQNKPIVVITKEATESCKNLIINSTIKKYIIVEQKDTNYTHVFCDFNEEFDIEGNYWSLDNFMEVW